MIQPTVRKDKDGVEVRGVILPDVDREKLGFQIPSAAWGAKPVYEIPGDPTSRVVDAIVPTNRFVPFDKPGREVAAKAIYTVKAHHLNGRLTQIPLEDQINNNVASPETFVGLQPYVRKGVTFFFDMANGKGLFCPTQNCWAEWNDEFRGFCSEYHRGITDPEEAKGRSGFGLDATTSARWKGRV